MPTKKRSRSGISKPTPSTLSSFSEDVKVSLAGMGDILHVQYRVTEEMTTSALMYLQDEATGQICKLIGVPKIGALTSKKTEIGNYGFAIFFNPDDVIKYDSKVTFVAGDFRKEHLAIF
jgi:hypothetical protein